MIYDINTYKNAEKKLYLSKIKAERDYKKRRDKLFRNSPRAKEIHEELIKNAVLVAKAMIKNNNDSKIEFLRLKNRNASLREELDKILEKFGLEKSYLEIKYSCKPCGDTGIISGKMCTCIKKLIKKDVYSELNCLLPIELSTFERFSINYYSQEKLENFKKSPCEQMKLILDFCKKYTKNFSNQSQNLLMHGATGLGKTHLSLAIAIELVNKDFEVIYDSTQNIISKIAKEKFKFNEKSNQNEQKLIECDMLIIDDLGTEFSNTLTNSILYNIVNSRIMHKKPFIVSTNLTPKELENRYKDRITSRIMGTSIRLEFLGNDIRQQKLKEKIIKNSQNKTVNEEKLCRI